MIKSKAKIFIIILILTLAFSFIMSPLVVRADGDTIDDKGVYYNYASQAVYYPQNKGFVLQADPKMDSKNQEVYKGYVSYLQGNTDNSQKYCLYELFGDDIHWYRYVGEATYAPVLLDHIWSAYDQDKMKELSISDIFYSSHNYLSCHVYSNRPVVLTYNDVLTGGDKDPRVKALIDNNIFSGYSYVSGSVSLSVAKFITSLISLLMGHTFLDWLFDVLTDIETSDFWVNAVVPLLWFVLSALIISFIISLVKIGVRYSKGNGSMKEFLTRFIVGVVCMGLMICSMLNPTIFNNVINKGLTIVDQVFEAALTTALEGDDIIDVSDDDLAVRAVLWKTAVFQPWCRGQFNGLNYDELYTNFASLEDGQSAMPQSNGTPADITIGNDYYYNSTNLTGDVIVPIGDSHYVRNWAAYLYSCGSQYHIDYSLDTFTAESVDIDENVVFPTALTTYDNKTLMADTFRVIDAQMDISPQYFNGNVKVNSYLGAKELSNKFMKEGATALFNSILLFVMLPAIFSKIKNFILLMITTMQIIYNTILELFKPDSGKGFFDDFKNHFLGYVLNSLKLCVLTTLYMLLVDKGIIMSLLYILLSFAVYGFSVQDIKRGFADVKYFVQRTVKNNF